MSSASASSCSRLLAAVLLACALAGCQRAAEDATDRAIERAGDGHIVVDRDGNRIALKTADGDVAVTGGDALPLPEDYPGDVYLPEGYAINSVMDLEGVDVLGLRAAGKVSDQFAAARKAMAGHGWKETMAMQHSADSAMLAYEKPVEGGDPRVAMLSFRDDGEGGVMLSVQLRSEHRR